MGKILKRKVWFIFQKNDGTNGEGIWKIYVTIRHQARWKAIPQFRNIQHIHKRHDAWVLCQHGKKRLVVQHVLNGTDQWDDQR